MPPPADLGGDDDRSIAFICNICGSSNELRLSDLDRETRSCACGSTPRWRGVVYALTTELFGRPLTLADAPPRKDVRGLGLSDARVYASRLEATFEYVNTFLDRDPQLDLAAEPPYAAEFDFIVASDVLEHVRPPVSRAFANLHRMLKPDGFLVVTVPYAEHGATVEHFPSLHDFELVERSGRSVLRNVLADGTVEEFDNIVLHGGPGLAIEMRRFSKDGLVGGLREAGFGSIEFLEQPFLPYGVYWPGWWSLPCVARREERAGRVEPRPARTEAATRDSGGTGTRPAARPG